MLKFVPAPANSQGSKDDDIFAKVVFRAFKAKKSLKQQFFLRKRFGSILQTFLALDNSKIFRKVALVVCFEVSFKARQRGARTEFLQNIRSFWTKMLQNLSKKTLCFKKTPFAGLSLSFVHFLLQNICLRAEKSGSFRREKAATSPRASVQNIAKYSSKIPKKPCKAFLCLA